MLLQYEAGLAHVASGIPVTATTTFNGFSVTKTFTALAVLQLVDRGGIELDSSAAAYLPDFPYPNDITVRQLLMHSAGTPNPVPLN